MPALQTSLYTLLLVAAITSIAVAIYAARQRSGAPAAKALVLLTAAAAFYCGGSAVEIAAATLSGKIFAVGVEYIGIAPLPSLWFLFSWRWLHGRRPVPRSIAFLLIAMPAVTLLMNWTDSLHHLYYAHTTLDSSGPLPVVRLAGGAWYWVNVVYSELVLVAGNLLLLLCLLRAPGPERGSALLTMAASLAPWAGHLLYVAGGSPWGLDVSPLLMLIAAPLLAVGLFRYHMLELVPAARERLFEGADGVIVVDALQRIVDYNAAAAAICRRLGKQSIGAPASEALADLPQLAVAIRAGYAANAGADGGRITVAGPVAPSTYDVRLEPVRGKAGRTVGHAVVLTDVTAQVSLVRRLQELATIDELTRLANRRQFFDLGHVEVARARREGRPISVALMDLDHFKHVNDRHGHSAGDDVLKAVADACRAGVRVSDVVGRYGGEEFAFLFPDTDSRTAVEVAERLRAAIAACGAGEGSERVGVTASFGVASSMRPAEADLEALLKAADRALYAAKRDGRNRVEIAPAGEA